MLHQSEDIEAGEEYKAYDHNTEREALLPTASSEPHKEQPAANQPKRHFRVPHLLGAFFLGAIACVLAQFAICGTSCFTSTPKERVSGHTSGLVAPPYVGSTERHHFPPTRPTNAFPSLFPTNVGYAGGTPTGAEAAVIATAPSYPIHTGAAQLVVPDTLGNKGGKGNKVFDLFKKWGNLSPWYSVDRTAFGLDSGPETPDTCRITGLHFLHRHGARYPTAWGEFSKHCLALCDP